MKVKKTLLETYGSELAECKQTLREHKIIGVWRKNDYEYGA